MKELFARRLWLTLACMLCLQLALLVPARADDSAPSGRVIELNFVFLHGLGGNTCTFQMITDKIDELLPLYTEGYTERNPGTTFEVNILARCYPGYLNIETWAENVAVSIQEHFGDKDNLIIVGHSMGGKVALYTVANNIGNLFNKTAAVVTINSPVRNLDRYYVPGGGPMLDYCQTTMLGSDEGICTSLAFYDSARDGLYIGETKHWLAFVSAEDAPLSRKYDRSGVDVWPRNMDDGIVPLPAQFSDGADVIYYGDYGHSDIGLEEEAANKVANNILRYIFGDPIECSVLARTGELEHEADWLLGTDYWSDIVGGIPLESGTITRRNDSFFKWEHWEDIVGEGIYEDKRAYSHITLDSFPLLTNIDRADWYVSENTSDFRLKIETGAAPLTTAEVNWTLFGKGYFELGRERTFYDVEITAGTPLAGIRQVSWLTADDPLDPVMWVWSEAQSPFRWFEAEWKIYQKATRYVALIEEISPR